MSAWRSAHAHATISAPPSSTRSRAATSFRGSANTRSSRPRAAARHTESPLIASARTGACSAAATPSTCSSPLKMLAQISSRQPLSVPYASHCPSAESALHVTWPKPRSCIRIDVCRDSPRRTGGTQRGRISCALVAYRDAKSLVISGLKRREVSERSQLPLERREEAGGGAGGTTGAGAGSSEERHLDRPRERDGA